MKICLYTDTAMPKVGGQETDVDALARHFQAMGHEPIVLAPHPRLPLRANDKELSYEVIRHWRFVSTRYFVEWYGRFLVRLHKRVRFDLLHCHNLYPQAYLAALNRKSLGIPVVITSHGGDVNPKNKRLIDPALRARHAEGLLGADALIAISRWTRDAYRLLCPQATNIVDIPNGAELEPFAAPVPRPMDLDPAIKAGQYLLFVGRLRPRKGVDVLLEALSRLPENDGVQLIVAGDGAIRGDLEALTHRLGLHKRVRFVGMVAGQNKSYLFQNARATVVPSREWEALGLVAIESCAAGTPVIVSDLPGLADIVQPGRNGFIVPPENPEALAQRLKQALGDAERFREMGRQARKIAAPYAWRAIAVRHLELFERLQQRQFSQKLAA